MVVEMKENRGIRDITNSSLTQKYAYLKKDIIKDIQELEAENIRLREKILKSETHEKIFKVLLKHTISSVAIMDKYYNFIWVNEAYAKKDFRNVSDFPGHNHFEFYPSDAKKIFDRVVSTKETYKVYTRPFEYADHPERGVTYWDWTLAPVLDSSGEVEQLILSLNDVTKYVRAQEQLRESEERYHSIFDHSLDGILLNLPNGTILSANPAACRIFGQTEEELCASARQDTTDLDDPRVMQAVKEREKTGSYHAEMTLLRKGKIKFTAEVTSNLFKDSRGCTLSSLIFRDITERKKSEEALRLSEEKFSKAFYDNQTLMSITRLKDGVFIDVNQCFAETMGYCREEMIGKSVYDLDIWADLKDRQSFVKQFSKSDLIKNSEYKIKKKTGGIVYVLTTFNLIDLGSEKCLLGSAIDITEQKKAEEALRSAKELFNKAFNSNPLPMIITSIKRHATILEVNEAFLKRGGYSKKELLGFRITDLNILQDINDRVKMIEEIKKNGCIYNFETILSLKPGEMAICLISGCLINWNGEDCILGIANEITELRRYQRESARLERLHLIGTMAAGIGHEIRNPMTTVRGFLQLLKERKRYAQDKGYMDLMIGELDRANEIITMYLSLANKDIVKRKRQNLNELIEGLFPLLSFDVMKNGIEINLAETSDILINKNECHQLILNLVRNGIEAMESGGVITIKTYQEGNYVVLAVQDQGKGIAPEVLEKIGIPFFTTKDSGTGLGLATCYSIAERHNAKIDIETSPLGTTFLVRFKIS
ncbi:MAG: Sporulation kinase E [Pelotomaculum sp. PtaB.Bin104]|nr:MAG: Sporulation kinase E [Pelotomaculum sp. PtaB.Bin104]